MYKTVNDADFRLTGSVVTFEGAPVLIEGARVSGDNDERVDLVFRPHPFAGRPSRRVDVNDPGFDFRTPALGYVNYFEGGNRHVLFGERLPVRRNKQGLTDENTQFTTSTGTAVRFRDVRATDGFDECVRGLYPTYAEALERLVPDSSIAVGRDFALVADGAGGVTLMYRRAKAGIFFRGNLYVTPDKQWLVETIVDEPNLPDVVEVL